MQARGSLPPHVSQAAVRVSGLLVAALYASFIGWLYARQPQTLTQVTGGLSAAVGMYRVNEQAMADSLRFFRNNQFPESRMSFARADPAVRDPRAQFYVAYSYYREGWGRLYHDDRLYREGLLAVDRAIALAPDGHIVVDDPDLKIHTPEELKTELAAGIRRDASDLNPKRFFAERK